MSLIVPGMSGFRWRFDTAAGRYSNGKGVTVTPAQNTKVGAAWAELTDGANVTTDVWFVQVTFLSNQGASRNTIVDIGIDPAAGTSYSVLIPDLLASCASNTGGGPNGSSYFFPIHIPAGSSIAARASINNGTVGSFTCYMVLYGKPSRPEMTWKGQKIEAIGITAASSAGTAVTSGGVSEGTWTSLGTVTRQAHWFQQGFGVNNATMASVRYGMDLSAGSAGGQIMLIEEQIVHTSTSETVDTTDGLPSGVVVPAGSTIYGRLQCSGTADSGLSMAAYAVS